MKEESDCYVETKEGRKRISDLEDESITLEDFHDMRLNSLAREDILRKLTDYALISDARHLLRNCISISRPVSSYRDALAYLVVPELIRRLEDRRGRRKDH